MGTLPSFFKAGGRLYRSWTVHQCLCSTSTVDSLSFLILAFVCQAYPAFVLHRRFTPKTRRSVRWCLGFAFRPILMQSDRWIEKGDFRSEIKSGNLMQPNRCLFDPNFPIEQSDPHIPSRKSTFSTGCVDRIARSKNFLKATASLTTPQNTRSHPTTAPMLA